MARSWNSHRFAVAHCKHHCISSNELDRCACIDIITTNSCHAFSGSFKFDCFIDSDSSTMDNHVCVVCFYSFSNTTSTSIVEFKTSQSSRICSIYRNDCVKCCMSACVGSVFNYLEQSSTNWYNNNCACISTFSCISRANKLCK